MANEIRYTGIGDLTLAEVLHKEALLLLADRTSLRNHPAIVDLGMINAAGSTVEQVPQIGLDGYDNMATLAGESTAISNTALTDASSTITVAEQGLAYEMSDVARMVDALSVLNGPRFAASIFRSAMVTFSEVIAKVGDGFAASAGTTTEAYDVDVMFEGNFALEQALVPGPYLRVLKPKSYTDWVDSMRAEGGWVQFQAAGASMAVLRGPGFKGSFLGCDFVTSDQVQGLNSSADWGNFVFGRGAIGVKEGVVPPSRSIIELLRAGPILVEEERDAKGRSVSVVGHYPLGAAIIEDARGTIELGAQ